MIKKQIEQGDWRFPPALKEKGWAGGALWYNRVAEMNGAISSAIFNFPRPTTYPYVMEFVANERKRFDIDPDPDRRFDPRFESGRKPDYERAKDEQIASALNKAYSFWNDANVRSSPDKVVQGNVFIDLISAIFGTSGIMDMRNNTNVHPLAQLSSIGRGMIEATIRNTMIAFAGTIGGGIGSIIEPFLGQLGSHATAVMKAIIMASLALGFTLFYVVPMMPFVYFIFAFSGWIKSIFEAMVAVPLWALAHIHLDGEGLIDENTSAGYQLVFEIFLRPILIIFGLLASISIFSALVSVLNDVFDIVISSAGGFNTDDSDSANFINMAAFRGPVDEFFFSVVYVVVCYMIGLSCFKLVDLIPRQLLRWMGAGAETMQEIDGDPAANLVSTSFGGTQKLGFALQRIAGDKSVNVAEFS